MCVCKVAKRRGKGSVCFAYTKPYTALAFDATVAAAKKKWIKTTTTERDTM